MGTRVSQPVLRGAQAALHLRLFWPNRAKMISPLCPLQSLLLIFPIAVLKVARLRGRLIYSSPRIAGHTAPVKQSMPLL